MVFSTMTFLLAFFPSCALLYGLCGSQSLKNLTLVLFSLLFYAWGEPLWVGFLVLASASDFTIGRLIERFRGRSALARSLLLLSLSINLGLLVTLKYSALIVETFNAVFGTGLDVPDFHLPIGISFYTFKTISYMVDVYQGKIPAQRRLTSFLLYEVSFFELVAGPIVRYSDIRDQIEDRRTTLRDASIGLDRFCRGLFKKVLIADPAGEITASLLGSGSLGPTVLGHWIGTLTFALQIYFDFSGYSDMAIGLARMFGFRYRENFKHPYVSQSATEFWRRWHISLGSFFRDYVYIPLGGNRRHATRNILVVWALTGLWHGAQWGFVLWGLYFGLILLLEKRLLLRVLAGLPRVLRHLYALTVILLGWFIFSHPEPARLVEGARHMFGLSSAPFASYELYNLLAANLFWLIFAMLLCLPAYSRFRLLARRRMPRVACGILQVVFNLAFLGSSVIMLTGKTYSPFMYFRF